MTRKGQKRNPAGRCALAVATALYVMVAMLNSSLVQSWIGAAAGSYFSREWGGKVRVGAVDLNPFSHAVLYKIELIAPDGDTVFVGKRIDCRFRRFPVDGEGLKMDRVEVEAARFHLAIFSHPGEPPNMNLSYIINYFGGAKKHHEPPKKLFRVRIGDVKLKGVDYVMDLPASNHALLDRQSDSLAALAAPRGVSIQHMRYYGIHGRIRDVDVLNDHVVCQVLSLSTTEAGGMRVEDFAAKVEVCGTKISAQDLRLQTGSSLLMCDVRMDYDGWESMADYCHNVWHDITLKPGSRVNVNESSWWTPALWGVDCAVDIEGHCYGSIDNLHIDSIKAAFGGESRFAVEGTIEGLPHIGTTRMDVRVEGLHVSMEDVAEISLPGTMDLGRTLARFSNVRFLDLAASFKGYARDWKASLDLNSGVGDLHAGATLSYDTLRNNYAYVGHLHSDALGVHGVLPNEWLSQTGLDLRFEGGGMSLQDMRATLEGGLLETRVRGNSLDRAIITASLADGDVHLDMAINDPLIRCGLKGNMDMDKGSCSIDFDVKECQLSRLGLTQGSDSSIAFSTRLLADLKAPNLLNAVDDITGDLRLKNSRLAIGTRTARLDDASLKIRKDDGRKDITLECDWFDAGVKGWFSYSDFAYIVNDFAAKYLPGGHLADSSADAATRCHDDAFGIRLVWKDNDGTFSSLVPGCSIASGTMLQGTYSYAESLKLVLRSDEVDFGSVAMRDIGATTGLQGGIYAVRFLASDVAVGGMELLQSVKADVDLGGRLSSLSLLWGDASDTAAGAADLQFFLTSEGDAYRMMVTRPNLYLFGQHWRLVCPGGVLFREGLVDIPMLKLFSDRQSLTAQARFGGHDSQFAKVTFDGFSLTPVGDVLLAQNKVRIDGIVDGTFDLLGLDDTPYFLADLAIDDLKVNGQSAGKVNLKSNWVSSEKRVHVDVSTEKHFPDHVTQPIELHGSFLADGSNAMDLNVDMHRISLQTLAPMMTGFSSNVDGLLSGQLHLGGTLSAPDLQGQAWVDGGLLHVDVTGVTYHFDDTLRVMGDSLALNNFVIRDHRGNQALLAGGIVYRNTDLLFDLALQTERLMVLDSKPEGGNFYGRLLVGAEGTIGGDIRKPAIYVRARTLEGSELHVPVSDRKQMDEKGFVHFVSYDNQLRRQPQPQGSGGGGLDLHLDLSVTPGVSLFLPMDFSEIAADMEARGSGDLILTMQPGQDLSVVGGYELSSGRFTLSLLQVLEKTFAIEEGSSLVFPGNLQDARFDVKAVYNQRVNLATLTGGSVSGSSSEYAQVQNVIAIAGTLENPSIKFDIRLPNADQGTVDQVNSLINLSSDRDMLNHTVSLLLLGRFANTGTLSGGDDRTANGFSSVNMVAESMGSIVTSMVKVVDVNFKVRQGAESGSSQIDVGISKQWEKFYFESSFGYGSNIATESYNPEFSNVLVGDMVVGYKIKPNYSFYGFNRTNTSYYTRNEIPYKQGIGLKWSKDFETFRDLFKPKK